MASYSPFHRNGPALNWQREGQTLQIEAWGEDSIRVRATRNAGFEDLPQALISGGSPGICEISGEVAAVSSGDLQAEVDALGRLRFWRRSTGMVILEETPDGGRAFRSREGSQSEAIVTWMPAEERFYGLGQHQHGFLDQKGCVVALEQRNTEVSIPFLLSSRGYGFLWNNPGVGRVELGRSGTRWVAEHTPQIDYWVTAADSWGGLMKNYSEATGYPSRFPEWAAGFWQSKLRYASQQEVLDVAREYHRRGLPLAVIVIDYFHWPAMGEWKFDSTAWPDPAGMVQELAAMGTRVMVSVWPTVNAACSNFSDLVDRGLLVSTEHGVQAVTAFVDTPSDDRVYIHHYDATNPEARRYIWERVRDGYVRHGIKVFWLDACEPELKPAHHENIRYHAGNGKTVGCIFPLVHQQAFFEGLRSEGEEDVIMLARSAWAGSARYGAAVWSGDIASTWDSLRIQVRAGLNAAMSGIPWWTTDIGGFHGAETESDAFRELIVRWFQYGVFCPIFRLHGVREPSTHKAGAPNEIWHFGDRACGIISELILLRERLRPYIVAQMNEASKTGLPPMRPVFFDYEADRECHGIDDQFLFGPDLLIAPILEPGTLKRTAYLPKGADWRDAVSGMSIAGGTMLDCDAGLESIPVFVRSKAADPVITAAFPAISGV